MSILRQRLEEKAKRESQLPVSGIIRLGIKQISKKGAENAHVMALYNRARAGEITMKMAEAEAATKHNVKFPFYPTNTEHFNVHPLEVEGGQQTVSHLLDLYGEDRGSGKKLYRFPVIFPDVPNGIDGVFKSKFAVPQGPVKFSSQYTDDGCRMCVYREPVDRVKQAARKKFVARKILIRGACEPATCPEFGAGACKFQGTLHFYVPGISGSGTWILKTGSTLASEDVFLRMDDLYTRCQGRLPNFTPDGTPVFTLTKTLKSMTYFDEAGQEKKSEQWVLSLETLIDMTKVILLEDRRRLALAQPTQTPVGTTAPSAWLATTQEKPANVVPMTPASTAYVSVDMVDQQSSTAHPQGTPAMNLPLPVAKSAIEQINDLTDQHDIYEVVDEWAAMKFGHDWPENTAKSESVLNEITEILSKRGVEHLKNLLPLVSAMYDNTLYPKDLGMPYMSRKFNRLREVADLQAAQKHLDELLQSGATVAKATMTEFLANQP